MSGKDPNAVSLGRRGGRASAARMTADERSERAQKAAAARWGDEETLAANRIADPEALGSKSLAEEYDRRRGELLKELQEARSDRQKAVEYLDSLLNELAELDAAAVTLDLPHPEGDPKISDPKF